MTDLATDYAGRILAARRLVEGLNPDRRDPGRFLEDKDAAMKSLAALADAVQVDQVFAKQPAREPAPRTPLVTRPRTVVDRRGRNVLVELRFPRRKAAR